MISEANACSPSESTRIGSRNCLPSSSSATKKDVKSPTVSKLPGGWIPCQKSCGFISFIPDPLLSRRRDLPAKILQFGLGQRPDRTLWQVAKLQPTDRNAHEPQAGNIERFQHPADLPVATFLQFYFDPGIAVAFTQLSGSCGAQQFTFMPKTRCHSRQHVIVSDPVDLDVIGFRDVSDWVEQRLGEFRIVGEEQQPLARLVEPADRREVWDIKLGQAVIDRR